VAYRSSKRLATGTLEPALRQFRTRNAQRGITGMLVEHGPRFVQLMEGEPESVERLWRAVLRDPRHTDVEIVADMPTDTRLFDEHPLGFVAAGDGSGRRRSFTDRLQERTVRRGASGAPAARARMQTALEALPVEALFGAPEQAMASWARLAETTREGASVRSLVAEAVRGVPEDLLGLARRLRVPGSSVESIYLKLIEPAARALGDRWHADLLAQGDVTIAMGALQLLVRQLGSDFQRERPSTPEARSALVALMPDEPHLVEVGLISEFLERAGWRVACAYPGSDTDLNAELGATAYDVLALCSSGAFERPERRSIIEGVVRAARAASQNPSLAVLASGRDFRAHPELAEALGADGSLASAGEAVGTAEAVLRSREGLDRPLRDRLRRLLRDVISRP